MVKFIIIFLGLYLYIIIIIINLQQIQYCIINIIIKLKMILRMMELATDIFVGNY